MQSQIQEVEISIEVAREAVELRNAAIRLSTNSDFKKLIIDGYFEIEAARMARAMADSNLDADQREDLNRAILGPGLLKQHIRHLVLQGDSAARSIDEDLQTLEELREEGASE